MSTCTLLPIRSLLDGKRRLGTVLRQNERALLVQQLFRHTLRVIEEAGVVSRVCVVSPDPHILAWLQQFDVLPILQPNQGLNAGLEYARRQLLDLYNPDALLVVLPDLPMVEAQDVRAIVELCREQTVVLAPDRHGHGTNALMMRPPDALPFWFGVDSMSKHMQATEARELTLKLYQSLGTTFDVDTPDDLRMVQQVINGSPTTHFGLH
jgi:2-phospho-L-lactate guanylyltransferase